MREPKEIDLPAIMRKCWGSGPTEELSYHQELNVVIPADLKMTFDLG